MNQHRTICLLIVYVLTVSCSGRTECPQDCSCAYFHGRSSSVDCSNRSLTHVPRYLPYTLTSLSLRRNMIKEIRNADFITVALIEHLDLSYNNLIFLEPRSFHSNTKLLNLDISHNQLFINSTSLPPDLFLPLTELRSLALNGNMFPFPEYPGYLLRSLSNLQVLHLDGISAPFGTDFKELKRLTYLRMDGDDGNCSLGNISHETFKVFKKVSLKTLNLSHCHISNATTNVFSGLINLSALFLMKFKSGLLSLQRVLTGLERTNITELYISRIVHSNQQITLTKELCPIQNTSLTKLSITDSYIYKIEPEVVEMLPETLEELSFQDNDLRNSIFLAKLPGLRNLTVLNLSFQGQYGEKSRPPKQEGLSSTAEDVIPLPPKLRTMYASNMKLGFLFVPSLRFNNKNVVQYLDLSSNGLEDIGGEWFGLRCMETLNLSNNNLLRIDHRFLRDMRKLKQLYLHDNKLRDSFSSAHGYKTFQSLENLEHLDLSYNEIKRLPKKIFSGLRGLKSLRLRNNSLTETNFFFEPLSGAFILDLSFNQITDISDETRRLFDALIARTNISVSLLGNPLKCECDQLDTLKWLAKTRVKVLNVTSLRCKASNGTTILMTDAIRDVVQMNLHCKSDQILLASVLSLMFLTFTLSIVALLRYKKWQILYLYYGSKRHINPYGYEELGNNVKYDAYMSYCDSSRALVSLIVNHLEDGGYKLFVPDVDIKPGDREYPSISRAIQNCSMLISFLTEDYTQTATNLFEFNLAVYEGINRRQQMVVPVLLEDITWRSFDREMVLFFRENPWYEFVNEKSLVDFVENKLKDIR